MVATRSSNNGGRASPKKHVTMGGRIEKRKKANKAKMIDKKPMSAEDMEFESKLMREVGLGGIIFSKRFVPPWVQYRGPCLMGLPSRVLAKIINFVLPIQQQRQQANSQTGSGNGQNLEVQFYRCNYIHPILWTCRKLRYQYGQLFLTNNHFMWFVPRDWDSTQITRFAQHAASVGVPSFNLFMDLATRVDGPGYKCYPHEPLHEGCRANLDRWTKEVYYGVETRVLANEHPMRRDDGLIAHFLHQAQQYRQQGKSWEQLLESLEEAWEAFLERRDLAEVNLGKDVDTMTDLYKASNARLEKARAASLSDGSLS